MKPLSKHILLSLLLLLAVSAAFSSFRSREEKPKETSLSAVVEQVREGRVQEIRLSDDQLLVTLQDGSQEKALKEPGSSVPELLSQYGVPPERIQSVRLTVEEASRSSYLTGILLPTLLPLLVLGILFWFVIRQLQGANTKALSFGQAGAREFSRKSKDRLTFQDVAGAKEAKEELMEEVEFLRSPKKFVDLGAKIPKGVLLMGPPGTGKTLLARAVAGEADVPFFHISGSEFVEMFVGVGAARVRDLFTKAKKSAPCIIFIDEIDAVGRQRGSGLGGSHDEREQTLNQILVEMDGFDPNLGVIIMAATNRPDVLDPALLRPGRFDRRVVIDLPDLQDRHDILKIHAKNKPFGEDADLRQVAERTPGFSGADLSNLLNEAAIRAARHDRKNIILEDMLDSIEKVLLGPERKNHLLSLHERQVTAFHEGGHALVAQMLPNVDPVHKVSIISRGRAAGYTLKLPTEDRRMHARAEFIDDLAVMLGGFVAEKEVFGDVTTGASDDLRRATALARQLVTRYGMSETLGPRTFGEPEEMIFLGREIHEARNYSEHMAEKIDEEVNKFVMTAMETARTVLQREHKFLNAIAKQLLEKETIERKAFEEIFQGHSSALAKGRRSVGEVTYDPSSTMGV